MYDAPLSASQCNEAIEELRERLRREIRLAASMNGLNDQSSPHARWVFHSMALNSVARLLADCAGNMAQLLGADHETATHLCNEFHNDIQEAVANYFHARVVEGD